MICPWASLMPAIPPMLSAPLTAPKNEQLVMVPWFSPARPPRVFLRSVGEMLPVTLRSRTAPLGCMYRNRPRTLPLPVIDSPEMVWPCPSKVPPKVGMGTKSAPVRSMSASR